MTNIKKYWPVIIISIIIIFGGAYLLANQPSQMVLFYSDSCPHCRVVEEYIATNNIEAKLDFQKKEVSKYQANATLLQRRARQCGVDLKTLGVPFFFDGSKCYMGDKDIITYFSNK